MPNILLCCHQFFPRFYTGTETLVLEVADEMKNRGYNVMILSTEPVLTSDKIPIEPKLIREQYNGHDVYKLLIPPEQDPLIRIQRESYDETLIDLFKKVLTETQPDICHIYHLMRLSSSLIGVLQEYKIPIFYTSTDYWMICPSYQLIQYNNKLCNRPSPSKCFACLVELYSRGMNKVPLKFEMAYRFPKLAALANKEARKAQKLLRKRITLHTNACRSFKGIFYSNKFMQSMFHRNGIKTDAEHILEFPIPRRSENAKEISSINTKGPLKIAFIGTLRSSKGPQVLLKACNLIKAREDITVKVWGAPDNIKNNKFMNELNDIAKDVKWVEFCGTFKQDKFSDVLEETDIVVIPSIWYENTPLTALSALAAKRILVVTDLGGLSNLVVNGVSGFTFSAGDYRKLALIIESLANDKSRLHELTKNVKIPNSIDTYVDYIVKEYNECQERIK